MENRRKSKRRSSRKISKKSRQQKYAGSAGSNLFSPSITSQGSLEVQKHDSRRVIEEIVDRMFDEEKGLQDTLSDSACSSIELRVKSPQSDPRLRNWRHHLTERNKVAHLIRTKIGKTESGVLLHRATNADERDKQTVKRVLDYAERLNPLTLRARKTMKWQEYEKLDTCQHIPELTETWPRAERIGSTKIEISGLPQIIKKELVSKQTSNEKKRMREWLQSKELDKTIERKKKDIKRVVEFFPNIDEIQIQGEGIRKELMQEKLEHDSEIELIGSESMLEISSDTPDSSAESTPDIREVTIETPPEYGLKINGQLFNEIFKRSSKSMEVKMNFTCAPFEEVRKRVIQLQNIGKKVVSFELLQRRYFFKCKTLLMSTSDEFLFDKRPFRLASGETRDVIVKFQPRVVDITKEKWVIKIDPQFFCRKVDAIVIKLNGVCKPSKEYASKLDEEEQMILLNSNLDMLNKVTARLASITPLIEPIEAHCPYKRTLTEAELFEYYNLGFACERMQDLTSLKGIYMRVKKPVEPEWDLKVDTLKSMILRLERAVDRANVFEEMLSILEEMKGKPIDVETKLIENPDRDRTRFLFVRGLISGTIDDWEEMTLKIEESFLKAELQSFYSKLEAMAEEEEEEEEEEDQDEQKKQQKKNDMLSFLKMFEFGELDEIEVEEFCLKTMKHRKAFRDSMYMHTYEQLCNAAENIVSIIESTELF
ncbi:uncharacterized protein LOC119672018 [Teleopsis dalmanni]|uniref:uncharacterized protein LOC119672018 n=1 Tax=Teleopsis dalmanni TaxID=139649 RepID=UPI0018CD2F2A|nr:uncharacterized protein LOC119672018 [Teleopsis dalmanni]